MSPGQREAFAQLKYGTQERKGFIVLTSEVRLEHATGAVVTRDLQGASRRFG